MSKPFTQTPSAEHTERAERLALKAACEALRGVSFNDSIDCDFEELVLSCLRAVSAIKTAISQYHKKHLGDSYYPIFSSPFRILASAIVASVQHADPDEVHPLCAASNSYIAFGKVCVVLDHLEAATAVFDSDEFSGADMTEMAVRLANQREEQPN